MEEYQEIEPSVYLRTLQCMYDQVLSVEPGNQEENTYNPIGSFSTNTGNGNIESSGQNNCGEDISEFRTIISTNQYKLNAAMADSGSEESGERYHRAFRKLYPNYYNKINGLKEKSSVVENGTNEVAGCVRESSFLPSSKSGKRQNIGEKFQNLDSSSIYSTDGGSAQYHSSTPKHLKSSNDSMGEQEVTVPMISNLSPSLVRDLVSSQHVLNSIKTELRREEEEKRQKTLATKKLQAEFSKKKAVDKYLDCSNRVSFFKQNHCVQAKLRQTEARTKIEKEEPGIIVKKISEVEQESTFERLIKSGERTAAKLKSQKHRKHNNTEELSQQSLNYGLLASGTSINTSSNSKETEKGEQKMVITKVAATKLYENLYYDGVRRNKEQSKKEQAARDKKAWEYKQSLIKNGVTIE